MKQKTSNIKILADLAEKLDQQGLYYLASRLDLALTKIAVEMPEYTLTPEQEEELLQKLPSEEELESKEITEKLKSLVDQDVSGPERILLKHNIMPLRQTVNNKNTSLLGSGSFGSVLSGVYEGQPVAVKITQVDNFKNRVNDEAYVWQKIQEIRDQLSPEAQKHLPDIKAIIEDEENDVQIIVMEVLEPAEPHAHSYLWKYPDYRQTRNTAKLLTSHEVLYNALLYATDNMQKLQGLPSFAQQELVKAVLDYEVPRTLPSLPENLEADDIWDYEDEMSEYIFEAKDQIKANFIESMTKICEKYVSSEAEDEGSQCPDFNAINAMANRLKTYMISVIKHRMPLSYEHYIDPHTSRPDFLSELPESKSLITALKELGQHGITWYDLHSGNIMSRPGTKELVLIDVGLYDAPGKRTFDYV